MDPHDDRATVEVHERGFDGHVHIARRDGAQHVRISGTRPQDGANVVKEVPAARDEELAELVKSVLDGDNDAPVRLLAHLGVLDPPLPDQR